MKIQIATVVALFSVGCMKQPPPVNAPVIVDIPPLPPAAVTRHVVEVRSPPRPAFHYLFRVDRQEECVAFEGPGRWGTICGAPADMVLRNAENTAVVAFHAIATAAEDTIDVASRIAVEFARLSYEVQEPHQWHSSDSSNGAAFTWTKRAPDGTEDAFGRVHVHKFAHLPDSAFIVSGAWSPTGGANGIVIENIAWSLSVIPKAQ